MTFSQPVNLKSMKSKIATTIILSFLVFKIFGQTRQKIQIEQGITYSPTFTFADRQGQPAPAFGFSIGTHTKYTIQNKLGIGIGLVYQKQTINKRRYERCGSFGNSICETNNEEKFQIAKIPIWLSVNLNKKTEPKFKIDVIGGYAFGKLLYSTIKEEEYDLPGLVDNLFFGFVGIEFQKKITDNFKLTFGSHLEGTNIYDSSYGDIQNFKIIFRISK